MKPHICLLLLPIALVSCHSNSGSEAQAYYKLGNALLDSGKYEKAITALHMAEKLEYKPLANVMFKLAACYANKEPEDADERRHDSAAIHYMELAIQMGYAHPEAFQTDSLFNNLKTEAELNYTYASAVSGGLNAKSADDALWETFVNEFQPATLPLTINKTWIGEHPLKQSISISYEKYVPEMRTLKFSRAVNKAYYYCALIKKDPAYTALIYAGRDNLLTEDDTQAHSFYILATYDPAGKFIDKMEVAGQQRYNDLINVFTIRPNSTFEIRAFKNVYRQDPDKAGYTNNPIQKTEVQKISNYRISSNGRFERLDAQLASR